jgi:hypothetical protein
MKMFFFYYWVEGGNFCLGSVALNVKHYITDARLSEHAVCIRSDTFIRASSRGFETSDSRGSVIHTSPAIGHVTRGENCKRQLLSNQKVLMEFCEITEITEAKERYVVVHNGKGKRFPNFIIEARKHIYCAQ